MIFISIADQLKASSYRPAGFNYLRIFLAISIVFWHSFGTSYGLDYANEVMHGSLRPIIALIIPAFFALSGFLVAGSLERSEGITTFLGLRVIRIVPALAVDVVLSALILGPLLTEASLEEYFSASKFYAYFLNIVGDIHYELPGLFLQNPISATVNAQLWTIPFELRCYIALSVLAVIGVVNRTRLFTGLLLLACGPFVILKILFFPAQESTDGLIHGNILILIFLVSVSLYHLRDYIPWHPVVFLGSAVLAVTSLSVPGADYFLPIPVAYFTIYLGLINPKNPIGAKFGDYSYGVYVYGFALQQAVTNFGPWAHHWYVNFSISLPIILVISCLSWAFIERPSLATRKFLPSVQAKMDSISGYIANRSFRSAVSDPSGL